MKNKINMSSISNKIKFIYGDECEKNTVGIIIFSDGTDYFFDEKFNNKMSNEEVEALLLRGAIIFKDGKYYRPASFNNENVSLGGGTVENVSLGGETVLDCDMGVKYIAHRGYSAIAPENTIPAYVEAGKAGFSYVETDIQETSDGEFVLMHDTTVDRTTNGTGEISTMTLQQVKELIVDSGNVIEAYPDLRVPTLKEFLSCCKEYGMIPIIEIKNINNINGFLQTIEDLGMIKHCIVISFQNNILQRLRTACADIKIQTLSFISYEHLKQWDFDLDMETNNDNIDDVIDKIKNIHRIGRKINVWTVNSSMLANTLINEGVDYITTDNLISQKMKIFESVKKHDATISDMQKTIDMLLELVGGSTEDYGAMTEYVQQNYDISITGSDLLKAKGMKTDAKYPLIYTTWSDGNYYNRVAYPFLFVGEKRIRFSFDDENYKISVHTFDTDGNRLFDGGWTNNSESIITISDKLFCLFVARKDDADFNDDYANEFLSSLVITVI